MEAPCICDCGEIFDLFDGSPLPNNSKVVCQKCADKAQKIYDLEEELEEAEIDKENAEVDLQDAITKIFNIKEQLANLQDGDIH